MRKKLPVALALLVIFSLLIFLNRNFFLLTFFEGVVQKLISAPKSALYAFKISQTSQDDQVLKIKEENRKLLSKMADYEALERDNDALRSQFSDLPVAPLNLTPARVLGFAGRADFPTLLIVDKGHDEGVAKGAAVVFQKNLVGVVESVTSHVSRVALVASRSFQTLGKTFASSGIVRGEDDFILYEKVVITDKLEKGEVVVTKGEVHTDGRGILPDLIIGKIVSIQKVENKPFQSAQIKSLIDFSKLNIVFILNQ